PRGPRPVLRGRARGVYQDAARLQVLAHKPRFGGIQAFYVHWAYNEGYYRNNMTGSKTGHMVW
ncbi:MAG: hypothetical protein ACKPKO_18055, partial [Candidatus Fonsibacter sp.]